ncbi:MAG: hypothetical protein P1U56_17455 [Saprospiraceae bacterium]|nr:hypothetical protein [Saprospiraceae bacterium]
MKKHRSLLLYYIVSGSLLVILLFIRFQYPELLDLETRWLAVAVLPIVIGIFLTERVKKIKAFGVEFEAFPSRNNIGGDEEKLELNVDLDEGILPTDYFFINHTSFLRPEKQEEFMQRTNVNRPHYDIRVIIDSYYRCALEQIKYVQYYLHKSYPEPIQTRSNRSDNFCLKEVANGEYVLTAEIHLKNTTRKILLERYITLWESGPIIDK